MPAPVEQFHPAEDYANVMRSSDIVVPILVARFIKQFGPEPISVLDLGCNTGAWKRSFSKLGIPVLGIDGAGVGADFEYDLRLPLMLPRKYDLVLCVEVGEHLPEDKAHVLVGTATRHASGAVIWSAATPGQGGHEHINEQTHEYWAEKFAARGWRGTSLTPFIPEIPHDYYRRNLWEFIRP